MQAVVTLRVGALQPLKRAFDVTTKRENFNNLVSTAIAVLLDQRVQCRVRVCRLPQRVIRQRRAQQTRVLEQFLAIRGICLFGTPLHHANGAEPRV